jgi:hypothetical protein
MANYNGSKYFKTDAITKDLELNKKEIEYIKKLL